MQGQFTGAQHTEVVEFTCSSCGHTATVLIIGAGEGAQSFLNPEGTAERRARADAEADVQRTLAVARCPKCGARDRHGVMAWWFRRLGPVVAMVLVIVAMGWIPLLTDMNMSEGDKWIAGWVTTGIAVVVGVPFLLIEGPFRWLWVDGRIVFDPEEPADPSP